MDVCITADDYGVSLGTNAAIESLARDGRIGCVSVMAHRNAELGTIGALRETGVSIGVHVCLTEFAPWRNEFGARMPSSYRALIASISTRPWWIEALAAEAEAQVASVRDRGIQIAFVNGHEHVHLLPPLWPLFRRLSRSVGAPVVRVALGQPVSMSAAGMLSASSKLCWALAPMREACVLSPLGAGDAGAMTEAKIEAWLDRPFVAARDRVRELCMHPSLDGPGRRAEYELLASGAVERLIMRRGGRSMRHVPAAFEPAARN